MAQTLLQLTNDVLRNVGFITGESGELTSLTDSARQVEIDICKKAWNVAISELYATANTPLPQETATATITLVTGQREYTLPSDITQIRWPVIFETDQHAVRKYPGGYEGMRLDQLNPSNYTGRPTFAVISPINGKLRFDYAPTASDNGNEYTVYYDKELILDDQNDTVPFGDVVSQHMVEVVTEDWRRKQRKKVDEEHRKKHLSIALRYLRQELPNDSWGVRRA